MTDTPVPGLLPDTDAPAIETARPTVIAAVSCPLDSFADRAFGTVTWQTLFSAGMTPTASMTCGIAHFEPGQTLELHCHAPHEIYFGLTGRLRVMVDGVAHVLEAGTAIFIPGDTVHGVFADEGPGSFFYVFPRDSFDEVAYHLRPDAVSVPAAVAAEALAQEQETEQLALLTALDETDATLQ
jgi:quercetin dioxygenase-like cupin family protein